MATIIRSKLVAETITLIFEFGDQLVFGDTISSPVCTSEVFVGVDSVPSEMILGSAAVSGTQVTQQIQLGNPGCIYSIVCEVTATGSRTLRVIQTLAILNDVGAGFGIGRGLAIIGELPDTYAYVDYYETLDIIDGYEPFVSVSVYSGNYPIGWTPTIYQHKIVTSGIASDTGTFTFVYKLVDFAGQIAYSNQEVYIPPVDLYGALDAHAYVGVAYSSSLSTRWGMTPYVNYATVSGTPPTGISIPVSSVATYSGTPTTAGTYTFTTRVTDYINETDDHEDTITVYPDIRFISTVNNTSQVLTSLDGDNWDQRTGGLSGVDLRFIAFGNFRAVACSTTNFYYSDDFGKNWTICPGQPSAALSSNDDVRTAAYSETEGVYIFAGKNVVSGFLIIFSSSDGLNWTRNTTAMTTFPYRIAYGDGKFVMATGGALYHSTLGISWTQDAITDCRFVAYNGTSWLAGSGTFVTSANGTTWSAPVAGPAGGALQNIVIGGDNNQFFMYTSATETFYTTPDGINWTARHTITAIGTYVYYDAIVGAGIYLVGPGGGGASDSWISTDSGVTWANTTDQVQNIAFAYTGYP